MRSTARPSRSARRTLQVLVLAPALLAGCAATQDAGAPTLRGIVLPTPAVVASLNRAEIGGKTPSALALPAWQAVAPPAALLPTPSPLAPAMPRIAVQLTLAPATALALEAASLDTPPSDAGTPLPATPTVRAVFEPCEAVGEALGRCAPPLPADLDPPGCEGPGPCADAGNEAILRAGNVPDDDREPDRKLKLKIYEAEDIGDLRVVWGRGTGIGLRWVVPLDAD